MLSHFEETIGFLERLITSLESERDNLRQRLDQSEEERRATQSKLTALLTYQPKPEPAPIPEEPQPPGASRLSWWPFRKRKR